MDPAFHAIFREQVEVYHAAQLWPYYFERRRAIPFVPFQGHNPHLLLIVTEAIEAGVIELGTEHELRADARLFLTINLHQMVLIPLAHEGSPRELDAEVEQGIKSDAKRILRAAAAQAGDRRDVTAGHILKAASEVLNQLTLKSWRLWD